MTNRIICSNCGHENSSHRETCKNCRKPLVAETVHLSSLPGESGGLSSQYEYLVVPFVGNLKSGVFSVENASRVSQQLQEVIDRHGSQGWDFYRIDKVNIQIKPGCLASLFGAQLFFITFDQVIFRKART